MPADLSRLGGATAFASLDRTTLRHIAAKATLHRLAAGETAFTQGQQARDVHFLHEGRLKITREGRSRHSAIVRIVHPGELFGVAPLMSHASHITSAVALSEVRLAAWPAQFLRMLLLEKPVLAIDLMRIIGQRLDEAHECLHDVATLDVPQRVLHAILRLVDQAGRAEAAGTRIDFPLSRKDLAAMTGTTLHNVSRILRDWERQGLIEGGRCTILVRDLPALVRFAAQGNPTKRAPNGVR